MPPSYLQVERRYQELAHREAVVRCQAVWAPRRRTRVQLLASRAAAAERWMDARVGAAGLWAVAAQCTALRSSAVLEWGEAQEAEVARALGVPRRSASAAHGTTADDDARAQLQRFFEPSSKRALQEERAYRHRYAHNLDWADECAPAPSAAHMRLSP